MQLPIALFNTLHALEPLSEELIDSIAGALQYRLLKPKEKLVKPGMVCSEICFVEKGLLRSYYPQPESDQEVTGWFMDEGKVVVSVESFFLQKPATEYIEALEYTGLHFISYSQLQNLYQQHHAFANIGRKLTEQYYIMAEQRLRLMRSPDATTRLKLMLAWHPEIFQRTTLGIIASYLGINPSTLSRLRAKRLF